MSELRVGIVGLGNIAQKVYLPLLSQKSGVAVAAVCDIDSGKALRLASRYAVKHVFNKAPQLVESDDVDVVVVCTPNYTHAQIVRSAIEADKHVICEKPLAIDPSDALSLVDSAQRRETGLFVGFVNRFRPEIRRLHGIVASGDLGDVYCVKMSWLRRRGVPGVGSWFTSKKMSGGGVLIDLGSHMLDLAMWLLPRHNYGNVSVASVLHSSFMSSREMESQWYGTPMKGNEVCSDVEDQAIALLKMNNRLSVLMEVAWATNEVPRDVIHINVLGTDGAASLETMFGFSTESRTPEWPLTVNRTNTIDPYSVKIGDMGDRLLPYQKQVDCFLQQIVDGKLSYEWANAGLRNAVLIDAIYKASCGDVLLSNEARLEEIEMSRLSCGPHVGTL